jgi:hypothetical protein
MHVHAQFDRLRFARSGFYGATSGCLGLRLQLLFAITFFVNHKASGVADFPSPDDPMLTFRKARQEMPLVL